MNRDIVRRLVKRKQRRDGRLKGNPVYRQCRKTKLFIIKRESERQGRWLLVDWLVAII